MKKTAVQQIIEALEETKNTKCTRLHEMLFFDGVLAIIEAGGFLEIEKQQIMEAYDGRLPVGAKSSASEKYYDENYKTEQDGVC